MHSRVQNKLENIGKSTMTLTEATVGAWPLNSEPLEGRPVVYVDPIKEIEGVEPFGGQPENILGNYLRQYYPPGVADEVGTLFIVKRDPGKMILFLAKGKYQVEGKEPEDWFWHPSRRFGPNTCGRSGPSSRSKGELWT